MSGFAELLFKSVISYLASVVLIIVALRLYVWSGTFTAFDLPVPSWPQTIGLAIICAVFVTR